MFSPSRSHALRGNERNVSKGQRMTTQKEVIATAPGKIILFGEHSVVYGYPALAAPVMQVQASCRIQTASPGTGLVIHAPDLGERLRLSTAPPDNPLASVARQTLRALRLQEPDAALTLTSTIPIARGLGSGAAVSTALVKALGRFAGRELLPQTISEIVFEVEKIFHGAPSGIDNTVVAYAQPVFFRKGRPIQRFSVGAPLTLLIGDTGVKSPTYKAVGNLRERWQKDTIRYNAVFEQMGEIALQARQAIEAGNAAEIGRLMNENHRILTELGLSSPELNRLVDAALLAGALGAKLSGAGWGGNMIALVSPERAAAAANALRSAGASGVIITKIEP